MQLPRFANSKPPWKDDQTAPDAPRRLKHSSTRVSSSRAEDTQAKLDALSISTSERVPLAGTVYLEKQSPSPPSGMEEAEHWHTLRASQASPVTH